ncbi:MAG TPA: hypothetical protein VGN46_10025 [Luteibacter sp.]|jgi:hypothetical protein|uniref:hypothetical protein n=1 Tax=Luteibacter sp. TaxID=1886636 RepID=UPI002F405EB0
MSGTKGTIRMLRTPPRPLRAHFAWVAFFAAAIGAAPVSTTLASPKTPQAENEKPEVAIDVAVREIERISNDIANGRKYFDIDLRPIVIRVSLSPDDGLLYFDTDARLGPEAGYTDMVDMQNAIEGQAEDLIKALSAGNEPSWRFGGRDTGWWLDEGLGRHKSGSIPSRRLKRSPQA